MPQNAVAYARYSPRPLKPGQTADVATNGDSVEVQLDRIAKLADVRDWSLVAHYEDRLATGDSLQGRPGFENAVSHACRLRAVLVVISLDRFSRNIRDALAVLDRLHKAGADLVSVKENLDTTTPSGRLTFHMLAAFAQFERETIAQRTAQAMQYLQSTRHRVSRYLPYGWMSDPSGPLNQHGHPMMMTENPDEQAIISEIVQYAQAGLGQREIARQLNDAGRRCRSHAWEHRQVGRILARLGLSVTSTPKEVPHASQS